MKKSIYEKLLEVLKPEEMGHSESDLYCKATNASIEIIKVYEHRGIVTTFVDNLTHSLWYEIPFAYDPYWKAKVEGNA